MLDAISLSQLLHGNGVGKLAEEKFVANQRVKEEFDGKLRTLISREEESFASDYRKLFQKASAPWITQIISSHSQVLNIDGWTSDDDTETSQRLWDAFLRNGWKSKQSFTITEALTYGYSYVLVLPSDEPGMPVVEPLSAINTYAYFEKSWDIYPVFALQQIGKKHWVYIDSDAVYDIHGDLKDIESATVSAHNLGFCPVIRVDEQSCTSTQLPIAPFTGAITTAQALTETRFHMLHIGRKATFPRLWATGLAIDQDENNEQQAGDIFATESHEAKFGQFQQADANGIINIVNTVQTQLAILTNTPPHVMPVGASIVNLSAEALASLEANYLRASERRKASMGQGFNDVFRTMAIVSGIEIADNASVHWDNVQNNSLSQLGDFISKVYPTGIDLEPLYQMIPGFDKAQADRSAEHAYKYQTATNAGALIELDTKRIQNAKELMALDPTLSGQDALKLAGYRFDNR